MNLCIQHVFHKTEQSTRNRGFSSLFKIVNNIIFGSVLIFLNNGCEIENIFLDNPYSSLEYEMICPGKVTVGAVFPVVIRQIEVNPRLDITEYFRVNVDGNIVSNLELKRGMGSTVISIAEPGSHNIEVTDESGYKLNERTIMIEPDIGIKELSGVLGEGDLIWDSTLVIHIKGNVRIPEGKMLKISVYVVRIFWTH